MATTLDRTAVLQKLAELDRRDGRRRIFGASHHQYRLNPPLSLVVIEAFERRHGVSLPEGYRLFLTRIGNGGAGPYYGVLPFGKDDDDRDWEDGGLVGDPSKPFQHTTAWNLPDTFWDGQPDWGADAPVEEQDRLMEAWDQELEARYWNPTIIDGAIPICHIGCALRQWLVIHGEQGGFVWDDFRADYRGLAPVHDVHGEPVTFDTWYSGWLDESLREAGGLSQPTGIHFWRRIRRLLS